MATWLLSADSGLEPWKETDQRVKNGKHKRKGAKSQIDSIATLHPASAAWLLGISPRTLRDILDAPRDAEGRFEPRSLLVWWIKRDRTSRGDGPSLTLERIRIARAEEVERDNLIANGRLIRLSDAENAMTEIAAALRTEFQAIERVHGKVVGESIRGALVRSEETWAERLDRKGRR